MKKNLFDQLTFTLGTIRYNDLLYFSVQDDANDISTYPHFFPTVLDQGRWSRVDGLNWIAVDMSVCRHPLEQMIAIGEDGQVICLGSAKESLEQISCSNQTPLERGGPLRSVRGIGKKAYAAGMKRQVYRRDDEKKWVSIDDGVYETGKPVCGFEAIDGFNEDDIYGVGWEGEIWHYNGAEWSRKDSPTNLILTDVCCADNGCVYICGQVGTLIVGCDNHWSIIDTDMKEHFWSVKWYKGQLYASSYSGIYTLIDGNLTRINFVEDIPKTFYQIATGDDIMCSIGGKDIMLFDGEHWSRIA